MRVRFLTVILGSVIVAALIGQAMGPPSVDRVITTGVINLILVVGYYSFSGMSGVLSFGHMAFATVGGYAAGLAVMPAGQKLHLLPGLPGFVGGLEVAPVVAVFIGGLVAGLLGLVVSFPLSRVSGLAAGLASAALLLAVHDVARNWDGVTRGSRGLSPVPTSTTLVGSLLWLVAVTVGVAVFERSRWGVRLRASRADLVAAQSVGISFRRERTTALVVSAFITGIAGALFVLLLGAQTPDVFFLSFTFLVIAMVVVGGIDSLIGSLVGGIIITVMAELLRQVEGGSLFGVSFPARPGIARVGLGVLMLVVLVWKPKGVAAGLERFVARNARSSGDILAPDSGRPLAEQTGN